MSEQKKTVIGVPCYPDSSHGQDIIIDATYVAGQIAENLKAFEGLDTQYLTIAVRFRDDEGVWRLGTMTTVWKNLDVGSEILITQDKKLIVADICGEEKKQ